MEGSFHPCWIYGNRMNNQSGIEPIIAFFAGVVATLVTFVVVSLLYPIDLSEKLVDECEITLPRNQNCVLIAVPESEIFGDDNDE